MSIVRIENKNPFCHSTKKNINFWSCKRKFFRFHFRNNILVEDHLSAERSHFLFVYLLKF